MILAAQFQDTATGEIDINKVVSGVKGVDWDDADAFKATAPQIQVQNATGNYTTYYYLNDGYVDASTTREGWCDGAGNYVDLKVSAGSAFWFRDSGTSPSTTLAGQVEAADVVSVETKSGVFTLVGNAFPTAFKFNSDKFTSDDIVGVDWDDADAFKTTAPQIQVQNATGNYTTYYYLNDGYVDAATTKKGWCDGAGNYVADDAVAAGRGFWFKGAGNATLKFSK